MLIQKHAGRSDLGNDYILNNARVDFESLFQFNFPIVADFKSQFGFIRFGQFESLVGLL